MILFLSCYSVSLRFSCVFSFGAKVVTWHSKQSLEKMTKRVRHEVDASEMKFLQKIDGVTPFNNVRNFEIRKSLNIELLLLQIEISQFVDGLAM